MDTLSPPSLEVTIISAEDLRINRRLINKNAFVTVETDSRNSQSTSVDREGGSYPSWDQKLQLPLRYNIKQIRVEVSCKTAAGVKTIGSANIPVSDFLEDYTPPHCLHFLSYRLRDGNGEPNGIVNFSVRLTGGPDYGRPASIPVRVQDAGYKSSNATRGGYRYKNTGDMAVGVPASKSYMFYNGTS